MNQNVISRVWGIQFDTPDLTLNITTEDVEEWNKQARDILQERAPLAAVDTKASSIDYEEVTRQYEDMRAIGLDSYLEFVSNVHNFRGLPETELRARFEGYSELDVMIDILRFGQRSFMKSTFVPNGGHNFKQSTSYNKAQKLCNHAVAKLHKKKSCCSTSLEIFERRRTVSVPYQPLFLGF